MCNGVSYLQRLFLSLSLLTTVVIAGCAVTDFVGAYFNTYYNAQKLFTEAEEEVLNQPARTAAGAEPAFLAPFDFPQQARGKFTSVIEKCSKLLQYHPDSKLVDDALLMIGKSYYYQNEHQAAERKFKELLATYPESDLVLEASLLLANTYYRMNDKLNAAAHAQQLVQQAQQQDEPAIVAKASVLLGVLSAEAKEYDAAQQHFRQAAGTAETAQERSSAYRKVAEMHELLHQYDKAAEAFALSEAESDNYLGVYQGQIGKARNLSRLGRYEESLEILEDLIQNTNYREFFGEIDLDIANVYRDQKDYRSAEAQYRYVDTAYARTEVAAKSYHELGLLYETKLFLYDSARVAFDKGKVEYPPAPITVALQRKSTLMSKYFVSRAEIAKYDSIKEYILHPPDTTEVEPALADSLSADSLKGTTVALSDSLRGTRVPPVPPPPMDTVLARLAYNKSELGGLFYTGLQVVDSARYWYERVLTDHPASSYAPRALYTLIQIYGSDSVVARSTIDSLHRVIVTRYPQSEFAAESRRHLGLAPVTRGVNPTETRLRDAELLVAKGDVASALQSYKEIVNADSASPFAPKAQYTIGWLYENMKGEMDSSIVHYERLVRRYPNSTYASLVQPRLAEVAMHRQRQRAQQDTTGQSQTPQEEIARPKVPEGPVKYAQPAKRDSLRTEVDDKIQSPANKNDEDPKP